MTSIVESIVQLRNHTRPLFPWTLVVKRLSLSTQTIKKEKMGFLIKEFKTTVLDVQEELNKNNLSGVSTSP